VARAGEVIVVIAELLLGHPTRSRLVGPVKTR
jgi:hypothetical protein